LNGVIAEAHTAFTKKCAKLGVTNSKFKNIAEAKTALEPLGLGDIEYLQAACLPEDPASREAYYWLKNFFSLVGENAPNADFKVELPGIYTKESIHKIYHRHIINLNTGNEHDPLEIRAFETLWENLFPNVTITKYCQVLLFFSKCF
jgi:hypothetical protein